MILYVRSCPTLIPHHLHLLFNCGLELSLCAGQFFPQTFALLRAPFQLLLKLLQARACLPVSLILLMEKKNNISKTFVLIIKNCFLMHTANQRLRDSDLWWRSYIEREVLNINHMKIPKLSKQTLHEEDEEQTAYVARPCYPKHPCNKTVIT